LQDLDADGKTLKWNVKEQDVKRDIDSSAQDRESSGLRLGLMMGSCDRGNISPGIMK